MSKLFSNFVEQRAVALTELPGEIAHPEKHLLLHELAKETRDPLMEYLVIGDRLNRNSDSVKVAFTASRAAANA